MGAAGCVVLSKNDSNARFRVRPQICVTPHPILASSRLSNARRTPAAIRDARESTNCGSYPGIGEPTTLWVQAVR